MSEQARIVTFARLAAAFSRSFDPAPLPVAGVGGQPEEQEAKP